MEPRRITLRLKPDVARAAARLAREKDLSLNAFIEASVQQAIERQRPRVWLPLLGDRPLTPEELTAAKRRGRK